MNKKGHVLNAILLAIGVGYVLEPSGDVETFVAIGEVSLPLVLGALFPDVDTAFGKHRKTLHNLPVLGIALAYPVFFGNLSFVWAGILSHYVLDMLGSKRGIALFYPFWSEEFGSPTGVTTSSTYADVVTIVVTLIEVGVFALFVHVLPGYLPPGLELGGVTTMI
ncbi:metal-dependent hydrolase [Halolamina litorea]|uniref:Metal-dependent hydrolase n=1 Tax=Halolamina litorea TaxID=1515593 RepID=A0ABD6BPW5_9EURY|nr:metal-dependent hydrolase [Halolamina litorea]